MLTELRISNFALIDQLTLLFSTGFQVLTGETGAGKSILVDAIALLIGGRGAADQIRTGAEEAVVEASFTLPPDGSLADRFRNLDLLKAGGGEIIIRRVLSRAGRHRIYVNGVMTPLHVLQRLAGTLVDIHGQHNQQSLLSSGAQLETLDAFGHLHELYREYEQQYERWLSRRQELQEAERIIEDRRIREDLLTFQYRELEEADLRPGEEEALAAERSRLTHARRLAELTQQMYDALYEGDASILTKLSVVTGGLRELEQIDPEAGEWMRLHDSANAQLRELAQRVRAYRRGLGEEPERLSHVEERLDRLRRLRKKYGDTVDSLMSRAQDLKRQLDELVNEATRIAELQGLVEQDIRRLEELGDRLSHRRRAVAGLMETRIEAELASLRMDQTRFCIMVRPLPANSFGPTGRDEVEYLLSTNPGEPLLPLARVVSGGELSRVMLAVKTVLAETDGVPILIFDEVDAGIGGAVASVMGLRLRALSKYHQVLCVTHLPQIASQASAHYRVQKVSVRKRTVTRVTRLQQGERRDEIARMLGGIVVTRATRETADEMINEARKSCSR